MMPARAMNPIIDVAVKYDPVSQCPGRIPISVSGMGKRLSKEHSPVGFLFPGEQEVIQRSAKPREMVRLIAATGLAVALSGCKVGPNYEGPPVTETPPDFAAVPSQPVADVKSMPSAADAMLETEDWEYNILIILELILRWNKSEFVNKLKEYATEDWVLEDEMINNAFSTTIAKLSES